ncbi:MAG: right-handed parallel beta-helix repeat-containing protein [Rhodobacteraceae bacterium]|nr:right-handed parallel beta-helix repeat-containing protein [Paracoccaceae bacterium]
MNKAITEGVQLMPPAFANGLDVWSSGDGTPGSDTYDSAANAVLVPADQDFGGCLEIQKTTSTTKLRYMGEIPLLPGCYLQIKARIKAISGNLPNVRIAGWAGGSGGGHVGGVTEVGPATTLTSYGGVVEVTAIVGAGTRGGVDMAWGPNALYGHFGLDLTGPNGGILRIDDIEITDVTNIYLRDMLSIVDVRDYGAVGDGVTNDSAAFEAADQAANGRRVLVPAGTYFLASGASFVSEVEFEGTVTMPTSQMLLLTKNFDLPSYISAFGNEELAFKKAFQALINNADHESLDMKGRKVAVTGPIDMAAAVPNRDSYATRRVIRNGQLEAVSSSAWNTETFTSTATYNANDARKLTNVTNIANIPVGALVQGSGVGREIYVRSKSVAAGEITLNAPLYDAEGTQSYTFHSFKYMIDFTGFAKLEKFGMEDIEFQCNNRCSAIRLAEKGSVFSLQDCFISRPKDRGITSIGGGCQGMLIDRCQFLSSEDALNVTQRSSIGVNVNANDVKIRNCRATRFKHFALLSGDNSLVIGNHFFQGDAIANGVRSAGIVVVGTYTSCTITGNYADNAYIEWTNETDPTPDYVNGFSFSSMVISDNIFLSGEVASWFSYIVVKPYGTGHFLNGVTITGNKFRSINGTIDRAERVDTSFADLNYERMKNVTFEGNTFHNVLAVTSSPLRVEHTQSTAAATWTVPTSGRLPFESFTRNVDSVIAITPITTSSGSRRYLSPHVDRLQGTNKDSVRLNWGEAVKGTVNCIVRMDK